MRFVSGGARAEVSPNSARALRVYGQALIDQNRFREAIAPLRKSVEIYPVYDYAWVDLGIAQMQSGDAATAETSLKRALRLNDENAEAHLALGVLYMGAGRGDLARPRFERAISLKPSAGGGAIQPGHPVSQGGLEAAGDSAVQGRRSGWSRATEASITIWRWPCIWRAIAEVPGNTRKRQAGSARRFTREC